MTSLFRDGALVAQGLEGEDAAWRFLNSLSNVARVDDVRAIKQWQDAEVDYRLHMVDGLVKGVEVKADSYIERTHNVLFELGRIHHTATTPFYTGWGVFSKADFLLVYAPDSQTFRLFRFAELRQAMQKFTRAERGKNSGLLKVIASDDTRTTINVLIPLRHVSHWTYAALPNARGWVMKPDAR